MKTIIKTIFLISITFSLHAQFVYTPKMLEKQEAQHKLLDGTKPLFINGNNVYEDNGANVKYGCFIFPFSPYLKQTYKIFPRGTTKNAINDHTGAYIRNYPISEMFMILYGKRGYHDPYPTHGTDTTYYLEKNEEQLPYSRVELRNLDSTNYVGTINGIRYPEKGWNIQLSSTNQLPDERLRKLMIETLEMQFGLKTFMEKQKKRCIVLSRNKNFIPLYSSGTNTFKAGYNKNIDKSIISINDASMDMLLYLLHRIFRRTNYPIVNETGLTKEHLGQINYTVDGRHTFETFKKEFLDLGIKFSIEEREVDVLIITKAI